MTHGASQRPEWAALETVHTLADAHVALASPEKDWDLVAATRFRLGKIDVDLPALGVPAFGINYGPDMQLERTLHGRRISGCGTAGHLSLLPPDAATRWVFDKPGDIVLVFLNRTLFDRAIEESIGRPAGSVEIVPAFNTRDLVLERIAHQLLLEIAAPSDGRLFTERIAQELAAHLIDAHSSYVPPTAARVPTMAPNRLRRAEDFILANLQSDMSLQDIANVAGMSLFHFAKAFKHATGHAPHQYLREHRLRRARALLHDANLSIGEVARRVGFTHSHFTEVFTKEMRMTPSKFREVLRA